MTMEYVEKYYQQNMAEDGVIADGGYLMNGMRVLIHNFEYRQNPDAVNWWNKPERLAANQFNRWCRVSDVIDTDDRTFFLGHYDDGTKYKFDVPSNCAWFVKLSSVQDIKELTVSFAEEAFWRAVGLPKPQPPTDMSEPATPLPGMDQITNAIGDGPKHAGYVWRGPAEVDKDVTFRDLSIDYHGAPGTEIQTMGPVIEGGVAVGQVDFESLKAYAGEASQVTPPNDEEAVLEEKGL